MEEQKQPDEGQGLLPEHFGCHFYEETFKSQSSRANHHKRKHPNKHHRLKGTKKTPDYKCKHCNIECGSRQSQWNQEQRCQSNPEIIKRLKTIKNQDRLLKEYEEKLSEENPLNKEEKEA